MAILRRHFHLDPLQLAQETRGVVVLPVDMNEAEFAVAIARHSQGSVINTIAAAMSLLIT